ncbi:MAG TPA: hypothetical protein PL029_10235 [Bacteroidia bacterium]|nr:hypothetical protein [Bacteroidia bacterium]
MKKEYWDVSDEQVVEKTGKNTGMDQNTGQVRRSRKKIQRGGSVFTVGIGSAPLLGLSTYHALFKVKSIIEPGTFRITV